MKGARYLIGSYRALLKIVKHRIALVKSGRKLGVPLVQILKHDNSKFSFIEFKFYVEAFELGIEKPEHASAWRHHWMNNPHHIEYWQEKDLTFTRYVDRSRGDIPNYHAFGGGTKKKYSPNPEIIGWKTESGWPQVWMPDMFIREMIADWIAASLVYSGQYPKAPRWDWGNAKLVKMLKKLEHHHQPECSSRGFALTLLKAEGMITEEQYKEANVLD